MIFKTISFYHVVDSFYCFKISCSRNLQDFLKESFSRFSSRIPRTLRVWPLGHFIWRGERWKPLEGLKHFFRRVWFVLSWASRLRLELSLHYTLASWGSGFVGTLSAVIPPLPLNNRCFAIITIPSSAGVESARLCSQQLLHTYHHNGQGWARETALMSQTKNNSYQQDQQ